MSTKPLLVTALVILSVAAIAPWSSAQDGPQIFNALMRPTVNQASVGDTVFVNLEVDATAVQFNGYETTIEWDPTIVELLEVTEGPLMLGACGTTFFETSQTANSISVTHVILCAGVALHGPGVLTTYAFRALAEGNTPVQLTSDPDFTFLDAGIWINPSHPTLPRQVYLFDATIQVGEPAFNAFLLPPLQQIAVGDTAFVNLEVGPGAMQFNGYETTIEWNPALVELVEVTEGALMTGACGTTFFEISQTANSVSLTHVILCGGVALDGPGVLTTYAFRGLVEGSSAVELTSDPDFTFLDAGIWINPNHPTFPRQVFLFDATIQVGVTTSIGAASSLHPVEFLTSSPNPFNPTTTLRFVTAQAGRTTLSIFTTTGREIWSRGWDRMPAGPHEVVFDRAKAPGLASGAYFVRLATPSGVRHHKMTLLK